MSTQAIYHRVVAIAVALFLWSYAAYSLQMGRFHIPLRYTSTAMPAPLWSSERIWMHLGGPAAYSAALGCMILGVGMLLWPAPAQSQEQWQREAKYEAAAKLLLMCGAGLLVLGIVLSVFGLGRSWPDTSSVAAMQAWVQQERALETQFDSAKTIWGAIGSIVMVALLVDLWLRYQASRQEQS